MKQEMNDLLEALADYDWDLQKELQKIPLGTSRYREVSTLSDQIYRAMLSLDGLKRDYPDVFGED